MAFSLTFTMNDSTGNTIACWTMPTVLIIDHHSDFGNPQCETRGPFSHLRFGSPHSFPPYPVSRRETALEDSLAAIPLHADNTSIRPPRNQRDRATGSAIPSSSSPNASPNREHRAADEASNTANSAPPPADPTLEQSIPYIFKVIPAEGPTIGLIEVSLHGTGFPFGHRAVFGDAAAETSWLSEQGCWCILPPRHIPGSVEVRIEGIPRMGSTQRFTYKDTRKTDL